MNDLQIKKLYLEEKLNYTQIAKIVQSTPTTVKNHLIKMGVKVTTNKTTRGEDLKRLRQEIKAMYENGSTMAEIASKFEMSEKTISYHLKKLNVQSRPSKKIDQDKFEKLWNEGKTDKEIADYFGVKEITIKTYRTKGENAGKFNVIRNFSQTDQELSEIQKQFIYGSLLGDLNLSNPTKNRSVNSRLALVHSIKQEELFMKKVEILGDFMGSYKLYTSKPDKRTGKVYQTWRGNSKSHKVFTDIYNELYPEGKKVITKEFLDKINHPIALAYWFMDDGCEDGVLATNCFSLEEVNTIVNWFMEKWDIECTLQKNKTNWVVYITAQSRLKFEKLIFPYMVPSMYYKLKYKQELLAQSV